MINLSNKLSRESLQLFRFILIYINKFFFALCAYDFKCDEDYENASFVLILFFLFYFF